MRHIVLTVAMVSCAATSAFAQNPISDSLRGAWNGVKINIKESAEQMPDADFNFKATKDVRSFGEILAHVAGASYLFCSAARGEASPHSEDEFVGKATTKAEITKVTNDAIAYCDAAFTAVTDATAAQMVKSPFGSGEVPRANVLIGQIGHDNEHYGNLVTYFRLKGMVPPSTKRSMR